METSGESGGRRYDGMTVIPERVDAATGECEVVGMKRII